MEINDLSDVWKLGFEPRLALLQISQGTIPSFSSVADSARARVSARRFDLKPTSSANTETLLGDKK